MLTVHQQRPLPFRRVLDICLDAISHRFFRSLITVVIIVLAIAFLSSIMCDSYLGRAVRNSALERTRSLTAYSRFLNRASTPESDEKLLASLADLREDSVDFHNFMRWGEFKSAVQFEDFLAQARRAWTFLEFFEGMPVGRRALLVEGRRGLAIFDWLAEPKSLEDFGMRLKPMRSLKLPGSFDEFREFARMWPVTRKRIELIKSNWAATVRRIAAMAGPGGVGEALGAAAARGEVKKFFDELDSAGLRVDESEVSNILAGLARQKEIAWALDQLRKPAVRTVWSRQHHVNFSPTEALISCARSGTARWVAEQLSGDPDFDLQRFRRIAKEFSEQSRLLEAERLLLARYGRRSGLGEKAIWLILVSFVVCVVGIANAMLMSVLERFKEIATMKCLGARNDTIALIFITESSIMGVIGSLVGMLLGFLIVLARHWIAHGTLLWQNFPVGDILRSFAVCCSCGLLLAGIAAIYPAKVASRMAPMDAMRVD